VRRGAWRYLAVAAAIQLVWGFTPSASRIVLRTLPVETYSAFRYTVSGCLFLAVTLARHGRLAHRRADLPALALLGVLAYGVDSLGTLYGLQLGGVLNFALASSFNAVITALVAAVVLKERLGRHVALAAGLSVGGGLLLASGKYEVSTLDVALGSLALIWGAYVLEALGFVFSRRFKARMPLTEYLALAQLSAGGFMWTVSGAMHGPPAALLALPAEGIAALAFVCLVSCGLCYFVLYWLLDHVDGHELAFFDCFHTLSAVGFGVLLFDEPLNTKMLAGGVLLASGVVVVAWQHVAAERRPVAQGGQVVGSGRPGAPVVVGVAARAGSDRRAGGAALLGAAAAAPLREPCSCANTDVNSAPKNTICAE
jgi:drug/metabolite transporter (DMT)-like permease